MVLNFSTSPISGGTQYQIVDLSTDTVLTQKRIKITSANNTVLYNELLPDTQTVTTVNVDSSWTSSLGLIQITVALSYGLDILSFNYLLPTTLNIKS